jgi:molybdopterin-guanine dinucleotide biosynthesis protein A
MPYGVVLAGGRSSRMGTDKAVLAVDGVALAVRVATALARSGCDPVWCQGGDAAALGALGLDVVADVSPDGGPLAAIATALGVACADAERRRGGEHRRDAGSPLVVVSACDLPDLDPAAIAVLLEAAGRHPDAPVLAASDRDGLHLLGVWRPSALEALRHLVAAGERSYRRALARLGAVAVPVPAAVLRNANRPEDLTGRLHRRPAPPR